MRLYNALIHYFLFLFLSLSISHCLGHEHHNHVDPVTTKYAQPAAHIDPLSKNTENAHVHQHTDDEHHHHDTIDARLRAKHQLRQSVHQHSDDGRHDDEEAYINRLNSALEDRFVDDLQFQHAIPPTIDLSNDTQSPNQTRDDVQHAPAMQNDTASTSSTSIQPPTEQKLPTDDVLSSTERPPSSDNQRTTESADKVVSAIDAVDETILTTRTELHEQQSKDAHESELIEEETLIVHRETLSSTPAHQEPLRSNVPDPILNSTTPTPVQQTTPPTIVEQSTPPSDTLPTTTVTEMIVTESDSAHNISTSDAKDQQDVLDVKPIEQPAAQLNSTEHAQSDPTLTPPVESDVVSETQPQQKDDHSKAEDTTPPKQESKDEAQPPTPVETPSTTPPPPTTSTRILRSSTLKNPQKLQGRHRLTRSPQENSNPPEEPQAAPPTEPTTVQTTLASTPPPPIEQPTESSTLRPSVETTEPPTVVDQTVTHPNHTDEIPTVNVTEPLVLSDNDTRTNETEAPVDTLPPTVLETNTTDDASDRTPTDTENPDQILKPIEDNDLPRQVHVHDPRAAFDQLQEEVDRNEQLSLDQEVENSTDASAFLNNDHSTHLPRILESEEMTSTIAPIIETSTIPTAHVNSNVDDVHTFATSKPNHTEPLGPIDYRQVCWRLPKPFESGVELIENQVLRVVTLLPEYAQTLFYDPAGNREKLVNTVWFGSISAMCFFFSFVFLSMGAKRLKQSQHDKKIRAVCQQLQQHNNQLVLERDTFEKQNQKLTDEIDVLRNQPISDSDEAMFELRERYDQLHSEWQHVRADYDAAAKEIDRRQSLIQKHDFEMQKQVETVAHLNDEILRQKQELEKERETIARLQTNDLSLERFETLQATIHDLKGEISQLKQEKFAQTDELQQLQEQTKQFDLDNNQLTNKMKQLKDLLQQRDDTISRLRHKGRHNGVDDDDEDDDTEEKSRNALNSTGSSEQSTDSNQKELLSKIDDDVEKANQHLRDLHVDLEEKTRRIKELDALLNQEKERCRELETKLKVVLELRERDAHLHIRQLGQTDAELRKARTDTERVRILQQQLHLKEQQLEDVQKVLNSEQVKFSEECSKLQHETHEKWMEVKKLTRELDGAKKECESLRRQISKYGNSDRSSQEKTMHKPVPHHLHSNAARASSDPETNGNSPPPPLPYQQMDNFRPIDHERNDSGAASPSEMFRMRPPLFGIPRPPFYPPPFMPPPPPNPFLMGARFAMPVGPPHGMISPISHLMTNGSGGGSDANSFEIVDSTNITPNSVSYDAHLNGSAVSPTPDGEQQATAKVKKPKKSLKKKTKTSNTTVAPGTKEDV